MHAGQRRRSLLSYSRTVTPDCAMDGYCCFLSIAGLSTLGDKSLKWAAVGNYQTAKRDFRTRMTESKMARSWKGPFTTMEVLVQEKKDSDCTGQAPEMGNDRKSMLLLEQGNSELPFSFCGRVSDRVRREDLTWAAVGSRRFRLETRTSSHKHFKPRWSACG